MKMPIVTTKEGLRVGNFSSPHPFVFDDGTELPGCSPERARALMLDQVEVETRTSWEWTDIELRFEMSQSVLEALQEAQESKEVDVVIVPLPVMQAIKEMPGMTLDKLAGMPFRVCRVKDRVEKTIWSNKFCL